MSVLSEREALLSTKVCLQARGTTYLARPRLREALETATQARLIVLSAPAGFGKTALLSDWLTSGQAPFAWLSLDRADNDPVRFVRYLREALVSLRPAGDAAPASRPSSPPDPEIVIGDLLDAARECPDSVTLVLDDYHVIEAPAVHGIVGTLIERLPPNARLAIATRIDPPLPLALLRARGELLEIRADALRFTREEAGAFFEGRMGLRLAPELVDILEGRTEGWVAALQLAALSLRDREDVSRVVHEFGASNRFLLDFIVEEVLANQPAETHEFLLRTSIADRLTGSLCDELTGRRDGAETLDRLERSNALLFALDADGRWYRYHALFAELLQARLAMQDPQLPSALLGRAAEWFENHGLPTEAIEHALRGGDAERARRLVLQHWMPIMHGGELWTVQRWLEALPAQLVRGDPQLSTVYAWGCVLRGDSAAARDRMGDARAALAGSVDRDPVARAIIPPQLELIEAVIAEQRADYPAVIEHARSAIALIPPDASAESSMLLRGDALNLIGEARFRSGDDEAAAAAFSESIPLLRRTGNALGVAHGSRDRVRIEIRRGHLRRALELCDELLPLDEASEPAAAGALHLARAETLAALGRPDEARSAALRADELARGAGDGLVLRDSRALLERIPASKERGLARRVQDASPPLVEPLTPRELEVLHLVAAGRSNREIAAALFVTVGTVKAHLHSACGKLGVTTRVKAILRGREVGLLD